MSVRLSLCHLIETTTAKSTRKLECLRENFGAASVAFTAEEIAAIDAKHDNMECEVFGGHAAK